MVTTAFAWRLPRGALAEITPYNTKYTASTVATGGLAAVKPFLAVTGAVREDHQRPKARAKLLHLIRARLFRMR